MGASVIRAQLGLLIRLLDTTTGAAVEERGVQFFADGQPVKPSPRDGGCFVFINIERVNFRLTVRVNGFEEETVDVVYEELDDRIPTCDIFLIPSERNAKGEPVIGIFGNLPFLEAIEAVELDHPLCRIGDFTEKTHKMTVIRQTGRALDVDYGQYGLLTADLKSYEKIVVSGIGADQKLLIKEPPQLSFTVNAPIARIVFGRADTEGNYLLRVRNEGTKLNYLVRFVIHGEVHFQQVDFNNPETCNLEVKEKEEEPEPELQSDEEVMENTDNG